MFSKNKWEPILFSENIQISRKIYESAESLTNTIKPARFSSSRRRTVQKKIESVLNETTGSGKNHKWRVILDTPETLTLSLIGSTEANFSRSAKPVPTRTTNYVLFLILFANFCLPTPRINRLAEFLINSRLTLTHFTNLFLTDCTLHSW